MVILRIRTGVLKKGLLSLCLFLILFYYIYSRFILVIDLVDWRPDTPRDPVPYLRPDRNTTIIFPRTLSGVKTPKVLAVIHSAPQNSRERRAIRQTWISEIPEHEEFYVIFLIGTSSKFDVRAESETFGDILQENFVDSYNNLTLKSIVMLKFLHFFEIRPKLLLKIDDDCYLHVKEFYRTKLADQFVEDVILGYYYPATSPLRSAPYWSLDSKWVCPIWMYPQDKFPEYLSGMGYFIPGSMIPCLYRKALVTNLIHLEDVYVTGILREKCGFALRMHSGFVKHPTDPCTVTKDKILIHYMNVEKMLVIHEILVKDLHQFTVPITNSSSSLFLLSSFLVLYFSAML